MPGKIFINYGRAFEAIVAPLAGRPLYVTFDIDGLDSALVPATGTPAPGGLA